MVNLEIIERSLYNALLNSAIKENVSLNPVDYIPHTAENIALFKAAKEAIPNYVTIYGMGNNENRGEKVSPRITVNSNGFYPGNVGLIPNVLEKNGDHYDAIEIPANTIDQIFDIHLVSNNNNHRRLLHKILFRALPQRGYIKNYLETALLPTGNIFIELVNHYDSDDLENGITENVYQFQLSDLLLDEMVITKPDEVPLMNDISLYSDDQLIINVKNT